MAEMNPQMNAATMLVIMVETLEVPAHREDIAATPGGDMLLVGTNDLAAEIGLSGQDDDRRVTDAFRQCGGFDVPIALAPPLAPRQSRCCRVKDTRRSLGSVSAKPAAGAVGFPDGLGARPLSGVPLHPV